MNELLSVFSESDPGNVSTSVTLLFLLTVLSLAPSLLILMTSFARIVIVLSFTRTALATNQMPPNQVIIGLALFLTFFIMAPTLQQVNGGHYSHSSMKKLIWKRHMNVRRFRSNNLCLSIQGKRI